MDGEPVRNEYLTSQWTGMSPGSIFYTGGYVGIGVASPTAPLSIAYTAPTYTAVTDTTTGIGLKVSDGTGGIIWGPDMNHSIWLRVGRDGTTDTNNYYQYGAHRFYTGGLIQSQTLRLIIDSTGKVGIGTVSPATKLDVWTGTARSGTGPASYGSIYATADGGGQTTYPPIAEFRHSNQTQGIGINFNSIFATGSNANQPVYLYSRGASEIQIQGSGVGGSGYGNLLVDYPNAGSAGGCITIRNSASGVGAFSSLVFEVDGSTATTTTSVAPASFTQGNGMLYCQNVGPSNAAKMGFIQWNGSSEVETMSISPNGVITTPNRYYIMGWLAGGTTAGNYITLGSQQTGGGMAITTSNKLVAPVAGLYQFGFTTIMNSTTGRNDVYMRVNGSDLVSTLNEDNGTGFHQRHASVCYYLAANDFVQYYCASGTIYGSAAVDAWHTFYFFHIG